MSSAPAMSTPVTIALTKGRVLQETLPLLAQAGIVPLEDLERSRKLVFATTHAQVQLVILRGSDVPTYVQFGTADMGVSGKDVILEHGGEGFYELRRTNGRQELLAVNADRRESDLDLIPAETLALWQNTGQVGPGGQTAGESAPDRKPATLWWYVVLMLLIVTLTESFIGSRYLNPAAREDTSVRKEAA